MKRFIFYFSIALMLFSLAACTSKNSDPIPLSKKEMLCRTWQVQELSASAIAGDLMIYQKGGTKNLYDYSLVRFIFKVDGSLSYTDEGGNSSAYKWQFTDNETALALILSDKAVQSAEIMALSKTNLELRTIEIIDGMYAKLTYKLTALP
jgi:hypothetical protein